MSMNIAAFKAMQAFQSIIFAITLLIMLSAFILWCLKQLRDDVIGKQ